MGKKTGRPRKASRWGKIFELAVLSLAFLTPLFISLVLPSAFAGLDDSLSDALFRIRFAIKGRESVSPYLVNVAFDNESLELLSRGTEERDIYARLIHAVADSGARVIACDIVFAGTRGGGADEALTKAVRAAGNVYLPIVPYGEEGAVHSSFDSLAKAAAGTGHIACDPDRDGVNRSFPLFNRHGDSLIPALPLATVCGFLSVTPERVKVRGEGQVVLEGAAFPGGGVVDVRIPIDSSGRVLIDYVSPRRNSFYTISAKDFLAASQGDGSLMIALRDVLEGSIVFISDTSARNKDLGPGVFGDIIPYSEVLLAVANSIMTGRFLIPPPAFALTIILLVLLVLLLLAFSFLRTLPALIAPICAATIYFFACLLAFSFAGLCLPLALPLACALLFFSASSVVSALRNERRARAYRVGLENSRRELLRLEKEADWESSKPGAGDACPPGVEPREGGGSTMDDSDESSLERVDSDGRKGFRLGPEPMNPSSAIFSLAEAGLKCPEAFMEIVTRNDAMIGIFREIEAYKASDAPLLIIGETGTGKELIARAVHKASGRKGSYIAVNVAGINEELFNDTLFGHKRGAYTGAERDEKGFVEIAEGGTLFLDEIGDLSRASQIKLLRLIENKEFYPLNSKALMKADVRIIAATNSDIDAKVRERSFRDDLARRLGLRISVPPLRERKNDIELLLGHFVAKSASNALKTAPECPDELVELLGSYRFPGNIRELESMVEEAVSKNESKSLSSSIFKERMAREHKAGEMIRIDGDGGGKTFAFSGDLTRLLGDIESVYIEEAMETAKGNRRKAAKLLGVNYDWLKRRVKD